MPIRRRRDDPEDAPESGDPAQNLADSATLRPHALTQELLDWLIAALEAVISTPEMRALGDRRAAASLRDALKYADHFYPHTVEVQERIHGRAHPPSDGVAPNGSLGPDLRDGTHDDDGDRSDRAERRLSEEPARSPLDDP